MQPPIISESKERVLQIAEQLFSERGYAAVTLRDIADELGMKQASLYYHVPGGKESLFIEVTERMLRRHRNGLEDAIVHAGNGIEDQLMAAAEWLLSQPRMSQSDMPAISEHEAIRLSTIAYESLLVPVGSIFRRAYEQGQIRINNFNLLSGSLIAIVQGIHNLESRNVRQPKTELVHIMLDALLNGIRTS
jgi:AcrR family transcriptional regulator